MKRKSILFVLALLVVALGVSAASAQDQKLTIGLVQLGTDNPFWIAQVAGGQEDGGQHEHEGGARRGRGHDLVPAGGVSA